MTESCLREIVIDEELPFAYSICTAVSNLSVYREMVASFAAAGFNDDCEFLYIDNIESNKVDGYEAVNIFSNQSRASIIILCHQDIILIEDRLALEHRLSELSHLDKHWGICGNAGANEAGVLQVRISDPHGSDVRHGGPFPARVCSLDENFLVMRKNARLAASRDIGGFHLFGVDLCLVAEILGWGAYVIDFHLLHKSKGYPDYKYFSALDYIAKKYSRSFRSRWIVTPTRAQLFISSSKTRRALSRLAYRMFGKRAS